MTDQEISSIVEADTLGRVEVSRAEFGQNPLSGIIELTKARCCMKLFLKYSPFHLQPTSNRFQVQYLSAEFVLCSKEHEWRTGHFIM